MDDVFVDVDDGNGNDGMNTNRTRNGRDETERHRESGRKKFVCTQRNAVHTCIQTQCQYQLNLYVCPVICIHIYVQYTHIYVGCLSSGWIMLRSNVDVVGVFLLCHGNWFDCVT